MGIKADLKVLSVPPSVFTWEQIKNSPGFYQQDMESPSAVLYVNTKGHVFYMNMNRLEVANPAVWSNKPFVKVRAEFTIKSED